MSNNPFNQPSSSGFLPAKQMQGHLLLVVRVHGSEMKPDNLRQGQLQRVVTADWVDLDEPGQPLHERGLIGNVGITNRLSDGATNILGRIGSLDTGQPQAAWVLLPYDESGQDVARATDWVTRYQAGQIQSASLAAQQAAQQPAVQQQPYQGQPMTPQGYPAQQPVYPQQGQPQPYPQQGQQPMPYQGPPPQQYGGQPVPQAGPPPTSFQEVQNLLAQSGINTTPVQQNQQPQY